MAEPVSPEKSRRASDASRGTPGKAANPSAPRTPFAAIYSSDPKQLADNLRRVGCPEETIKDIMEEVYHYSLGLAWRIAPSTDPRDHDAVWFFHGEPKLPTKLVGFEEAVLAELVKHPSLGLKQ